MAVDWRTRHQTVEHLLALSNQWVLLGCGCAWGRFDFLCLVGTSPLSLWEAE
jgi:hypothetical protein